MRSQKVVGRAEGEHEQYRPVRVGRLSRVLTRLGHLRIRTRFFLGLAVLTLVAVAGGVAGFLGLEGMNRLLAARSDEELAMVGQLAEARARLTEAMSGVGQAQASRDAEALSSLLSEIERATRNLDRLIAEGREREQRLAEIGRHRYVTAVTWLTLLTALAVALSLALVFLYNRIVATPLHSLVGALERVAAGDLTVSLRHRSRDEIGQVAVATGQMVERLRGAGAQMVQHERLRTLGEVSASVAHKFNNLLAVTLGQAELLQVDASAPQEGLETIRRAALEGRETVRRLQHFTKSGAYREEPAWVVPHEAVDEVIASVMPAWEAKARERGVKYEVVTDYAPAPPVRLPVSALTEVLQNLLLNALEAMPAGGRVRIRVAADHQHVLFAVSDTGEGIPPAVRARIFDPFFTTKPAPASGLGLSICSRIMLNLRGTVAVETVPRQGSTFTVRLPLPRDVGKPVETRPAGARPMPNPARILVIDDEPQVADTLAQLLSGAGHVVETALNGAVGIERYRQRRFDCVVTDLVMPGLTGLTVGRAIKDQDPGAYVILLTAQAEQLEAGQTEAAGIDRLMTKPVSREQLLRMFESDHTMAKELAMETSCPRR